MGGPASLESPVRYFSAHQGYRCRRLTLPSSGLARAGRATLVLHFPLRAACPREPLMSNVSALVLLRAEGRPVRFFSCFGMRLLSLERLLFVFPPPGAVPASAAPLVCSFGVSGEARRYGKAAGSFASSNGLAVLPLRVKPPACLPRRQRYPSAITPSFPAFGEPRSSNSLARAAL